MLTGIGASVAGDPPQLTVVSTLTPTPTSKAQVANRWTVFRFPLSLIAASVLRKVSSKSAQISLRKEPALGAEIYTTLIGGEFTYPKDVTIIGDDGAGTICATFSAGGTTPVRWD